MDKTIIGVNSRIYQQANTGIPYFIKSLYENLLKKSDYEYIFFQTNNNKSLGETRIIKAADKSFLYPLFDLFLINKLIKKEGINIFHGASNIIPFFKKKNVRYIVTIHDLSFKIFPENHSKLFNLYYNLGTARSVKNAEVIVSVSENTKRDILKFYNVPENKIKVIHLGVNEIFFKRNKKTRLIKSKYFLSITTHPKRKNIYSVIEAFSKNKDLKDLKYVIAGYMPEEQLELLKNKIEELGLKGRVILFGYAKEEDLINLYQNAEFFIYPSFYEGFGFPVLESMACKCPVITSNNSSLIEITPNKKWLVNPYDLKDISNKMSNLIKLKNKEKEKLINLNYNFSKKFSWDKTAKEYSKLFKDLK
ncbi:MAG: glycosyltransferase family 1 protein [Candidatus Pacearchaeota archaeon]|jgi:hypothetical protein